MLRVERKTLKNCNRKGVIPQHLADLTKLWSALALKIQKLVTFCVFMSKYGQIRQKLGKFAHFLGVKKFAAVDFIVFTPRKCFKIEFMALFF